jgi:hypothetical protein
MRVVDRESATLAPAAERRETPDPVRPDAVNARFHGVLADAAGRAGAGAASRAGAGAADR